MILQAVETPDILERWYPDDSVVHISKIDNSPNQSFNYNAIGWIRNNVATLMSIQNESAFQLAYSRLQELPDSSNLIETLSDTDNLKMILPKNFQDPVEFSRFVDYVSKINEDFILDSIQDIPKVDDSEVKSEGSD